MAPISSAGNFIPAAQSPRSQVERSAPAAKIEEAVQQEKQLQRASDEKGRRSSEQVEATNNDQTSPSVAQADDKKSAGEQQKTEVAQQEAQRAEFDQQAGNVRETESNDVRPFSNSSSNFSSESETSATAEVVKVEPLRAENAAIDTFVKLQNFETPSRQGQEVNRFA
jgi:hypothetical protein